MFKCDLFITLRKCGNIDSTQVIVQVTIPPIQFKHVSQTAPPDTHDLMLWLIETQESSGVDSPYWLIMLPADPVLCPL